MKRLSGELGKIHSRVAAWTSLAWFYTRSSRLFIWMSVALLAVSWGAAFFAGGYFYSQRHFDRLMADFERVSLRYNLPYEGVSWSARFSALQRHIEISATASDEVKRFLYEKDQKIKELEEQLYFYRTVIAPEDEKRDLSVFSVQLRPAEPPHDYAVEVVLRNHLRRKGALKGRVRVRVEGRLGVRGVRQLRDDFLPDAMNFSFKYFQRLEGVLNLPDDFRPERLTVVVSSGQFEDVEAGYAWSALLEASR